MEAKPPASSTSGRQEGKNMKEANPRAHLNRLIADRNYLGARLFLKDAEVADDERDELMGLLATAVVDELSRTRRDDRERIIYLRSVLAWILREIPGLGSFYREQLRGIAGGNDFFSEVARGVRTFGDVASGRRSVGEGMNDVADDARRSFEDATERIRSGESSEQLGEFFTNAEKGLRQGLDQLGAFFRAMNDAREASDAEASGYSPEDGRAAARAAGDRDVEDAEFATEDRPPGPDDSSQDIHVERD